MTEMELRPDCVGRHVWGKRLLILLLLLLCVNWAIIESADQPNRTGADRVSTAVHFLVIFVIGIGLIRKRQFAKYPVFAFCYAMYLLVPLGVVAGLLHHYGHATAPWFWPFYASFGFVLLSIIVLTLMDVFAAKSHETT